MTDQLKSLHACWCRLTGQDPQKVRYQACERYLWDLHNNGFAEDDLRCVLEFVIYQNKKREPRYRVHLNLHSMLSDMGWFASMLGEAAAWERNRVRPPTEKARTVALFRGELPVIEKAGHCRHISDVFKAIKEQP